MEHRPGESKELFMQVADGLRDEISRGAYAPGDRLPSIRSIAQKYKTSAVTARNGLLKLSEQGLIRPDSTRGYVVAASAEAPEQASDHSPEYLAIMREIRELRGEMQRLAQRLDSLEGSAGRE